MSNAQAKSIAPFHTLRMKTPSRQSEDNSGDFFHSWNGDVMREQSKILENTKTTSKKERKVHLFAGGLMFAGIAEILIRMGFIELIFANKNQDILVLGAGILTLAMFVAGWWLTKRLFLKVESVTSDSLAKRLKFGWIIFTLIMFALLNTVA